MEINQFILNPIQKNGQPVLTTAQLAEAYDTTPIRISNNFNRNKEHFKEGIHYYRLTGEELKTFFAFTNLVNANTSKVRELYLWTERGALLHAKSLNTEKAWEVYEFLVDNYFHTRDVILSDSYLSVQVIEKLELMEQNQKSLEHKIDTLEREIKTLDKNSERRTDNIINTLFDISSNVISKSFQIIYDKFSK